MSHHVPGVVEVEEEETEAPKELFIDVVQKSSRSNGKEPEILMKRISINIGKTKLQKNKAT